MRQRLALRLDQPLDLARNVKAGFVGQVRDNTFVICHLSFAISFEPKARMKSPRSLGNGDS
jgi:hypothetical protein